MAIRRLESAYQEIAEVRSRLLLRHWDTITYEVRQRLRDLGTLIGSNLGDELHRHVVVGAIAALQTFHRGTIVSIVDSGDEYKDRAAESITEKFSMKDALNWLSGKTVTIGELVAHVAPCNSVTDLLAWLGNLLARDMKLALADAIDPFDLRSGKEPATKLVADVDRMIARVAETFRLRHIFAHEAAPSVKVTTDECRDLHEAVTQWVSAVDAVLWATVYKHLPLTQREINMLARAEVVEARRKLAKEMRKALTGARTAGTSKWLRKNHFEWMNVTMSWVRNTYGSLDGTMWPAVGSTDFAKAIHARAEQVNGWNTSLSLGESPE